MAQVSLAFFWHQHQPYYPDDVAGENAMPWVRLHGVKDYYGMAVHLLEFPEVRCTINMVPSLLMQIKAYVEGKASDRFLDVARLPAADLAESDALFLLDHYFMANHETMIRAFPRYGELLQRRALGRNTAREALRRFQPRDLRDLQVWFNLAWVHPLAVEADPNLSELRSRGRNFTEEEKNYLLDQHLEIMKKILPLHRQLAESGQIELTTTPFYHPILPLLFDKRLAREAMPDVKLPRYVEGYPEDAAEHVRRAVAFHEQTFGHAPRGMWPAEGSVCQAMLPLLHEHGIRWIATDEEILSCSTQGFVGRDQKGSLRNPEHMYRPYKVGEAGRELSIVFRDRALSDMVGFHYQRSDPLAAAEDFVNHLRNIGAACHNHSPVLVPVILDGENCWEHYAGGGVAFLRSLYDRLSKASEVRAVSLGKFLDEHPPRDSLPHLFAGSWIHHNFAIWIGHEEDNTGWDALHRAREHLKRRQAESTQLSPDVLARAWDELYIAEGSDWFWWYGDDHSSEQDELFDALFRKHLANIYLLLGDTPPADLARPISRHVRRAIHTQPTSFLDVKVDGKRGFLQWLGAGKYLSSSERAGAMEQGASVIKQMHFGFNSSTLFIRLDFNNHAGDIVNDYEALRVSFVEPADWELLLVRQPEPAAWDALLRFQGAPVRAPGLEWGIDQIVELGLPFAALGLQPEQPIQFFVELLEHDQSRDRAPHESTINLICPSADFEQIMWDV